MKDSDGNGWIKIDRNIIYHWTWKDSRYLKWWMAILLQVNHTEIKIPVNGELITCQPGESFRSINEWCNLCGTTKKAFYKFLKMLEEDQMIKRKTIGKGNRRKHLLSVVNWPKYQEKGTRNATESGTQKIPLTRMIKNDKELNNIFEDFRKQYPGVKRGLKTELDNFLKKNPPETVRLLLPALQREKAHRKKLSEQKKFVPDWAHLKTWINNKNWEREFTSHEISTDDRPKKTIKEILAEEY